MSVPESVRKAAEEANKFIASQNTAAENAQAATLQDELKPAGIPEPKPEGEQATTPVAKPEPKEHLSDDFKPLDKPLGDDDAKWQDRYKILQGKYNAETKRLIDENKFLKEQAGNAKPVDQSELQSLKAEVDRLTQQLQSGAQSKPTYDMSEREKTLREDLGDEMFDFFEEKFSAQSQMLSQKVDQVSSRVDQTVNQSTVESRKSAMRGLLNRNGVDFDARNADPLFIDYLNSHAENGVALVTVLNDAFTSGDIEKASGIFLSYDSPTTNAQHNRGNDLSQHVQVKTSAAPSDTAPQSETWTTEQIDAFYRDKTLGKIAPDVAARYEKSLFDWLSRQK